MGWDGFDEIEVIMNVENTFGMSIPDKDAEQLKTAGELHAYVCRRLGATIDDSCRCAGAAAFYRARRIIGEVLNINTRAIKPSTDISELLPVSNEGRRAQWQKLRAALGREVPRLHRPVLIEGAIMVAGWLLLVMAPAVGVLLYLRHQIRSEWLLVCVLLWAAMLLAEVLLVLATRRFAVRVPRLYSTTGAISSLLMGPEVNQLDRRKSGWHQHEVWEMVRWWCAKSARIPPAAIEKQTTFKHLNAP